MRDPRKFGAWVALALVVLLLDQASKAAMLSWFHDLEVRTYTAFFDLVLYYNTGAAFSFLAGASGWQAWIFGALAVGVSVAILIALWRHPQQSLQAAALSLVMGGAIGNLVDRLRMGKVVDFLQFHLGGHYWPAFNLADSAIVLGAMLLIWDSFRARSPR